MPGAISTAIPRAGHRRDRSARLLDESHAFAEQSANAFRTDEIASEIDRIAFSRKVMSAFMSRPPALRIVVSCPKRKRWDACSCGTRQN